MGEDQRKIIGEVHQMKVININKPHTIEPIEWTPYTGETVVVNTIIRKGQRIQETKYFEDKVKAVPKGNAYIIGNGPSRKDFDLTLLKDSGQTYGCNALYRDFKPDYLFMVDAKISKEISDSKVWEQGTVCYAPSLEVNRHKGLSLIPLNPHYTSGNQAAHTAIIHGHKELYFIGFDFREYGKGQLNNIYQDTENYGPRNDDGIFQAWLSSFRRMIKERPYVNFNIVHDNPPEYLNHLHPGDKGNNTRLMTYEEFTSTVLDQNA